MSAVVGLNAELYRQLGYVADDEVSMKKILRYVKGVVAKKEARNEAADSYVPLTHDELVMEFKGALDDLKQSLDGKVKYRPVEELIDEL